jgi:uncharacterized protein YbjT (DUF2867 family)
LRLGLLALLALLASGWPAAVPAASTARVANELILVAGGSGREGLYVVRRLQAAGAKFRATTRDKAEAITRGGPESKQALSRVNWVEADARIRRDLDAAMAGVTRVICVIGSRSVEGPNRAELVDYGGVRNLVDAARAAGVKHFVLLTAIGVTDPNHPFNRASKGALQWRYRGEEYLRASGVPYTIVRPAGLVNEPAGQKGVRFEQGDHWKPLIKSTISRDDLARVLIEAVRNPALRNVTFEIVNDSALPPDGWRETLRELKPD